MADIFISYASEDRARAGMLAHALGARGWSIWWDREIPLGESFDEVIEKALADTKCVVVLWSAVSVASEWVRNEASEAKRRGILIPVFIESVEAPLAFRLLNGADLRDWKGDQGDPEFQRLVERVIELLTQKPDATNLHDRLQRTASYRDAPQRQRFTARIAALSVAALVGAGILGYFVGGDKSPSRPPDPPAVSVPRSPQPDLGDSDMERRIRELVGSLGAAVPATSIAKGFHVPDLGLRIAFLTPEQSASTLGAMPAGAVVMEVESGRPIAKAGIHVGDVVLSIAGRKIASEDDLRQAIFKIGPGKTQYSYRRGSDTNTVTVDCPNCKAD
jgi:TIR domain-containing protein/PDZ domain-containing protein